MPWKMQVFHKGVWLDVHSPDSNSPYLYDTEEEAEKYLQVTYPEHMRRNILSGERKYARVVEADT